MGIHALLPEDRAQILISKDKVIKVNEIFCSLTGYSQKEIKGLSLNELKTLLFKNDNVEFGQSLLFLFTKASEIREVEMSVPDKGAEKPVTLELVEREGGRFENKLVLGEKFCKDGIIMTAIFGGKDLQLLRAGQAYMNCLRSRGLAAEESIGKFMRDIIPHWESNRFKMAIEHINKHKNTYQLKEWCLRDENGDERYYDCTLTPIVEGNNVTYVVVMFYDITEDVFSKRELERQCDVMKMEMCRIDEKRRCMKLVMDNIPGILIIFDNHGKVIELNGKAREIGLGDGFEDVEAYGRKVKFFDEWNEEIPSDQHIYSLVSKGLRVDGRRTIIEYGKDKRYVVESGIPVMGEDGNFLYGIISMADATEAARTHIEVRNQKMLLESVMDNMQEAMFIFNSEDEYAFINTEGKKLLSKKIRYLKETNQNIRINYMDGSTINSENSPINYIKKGKSFKDWYVEIENGSDRRYCSMNGTPLFDRDGNFLYGIICTHDITEHIKMTEEFAEKHEKLLMAEKKEKEYLEGALKMKEEFMYTISHEFKTPLTLIYSAIQAMELLCFSEISERAKGFIQKIKQNSLRQIRLVNNLLDLTKSKNGYMKINKENVDIVFLLNTIVESVDLYIKQSGLNITFETKLRRKYISIDEEKLERIMLNLLSNAIKFTPREKNIYVSLYEKGRNIFIEVRDEGIGMPEEKFGEIFERFGQINSSLSRTAEGTGIGLSLVKLLVEAMNGIITVESREGVGSTFRISFPSSKIPKDKEPRRRNEINDCLIEALAVEFSDIYI